MSLTTEENTVYQSLKDPWCLRGEFLVLRNTAGESYELNRLCSRNFMESNKGFDITEDNYIVLSMQKVKSYFSKKGLEI